MAQSADLPIGHSYAQVTILMEGGQEFGNVNMQRQFRILTSRSEILD